MQLNFLIKEDLEGCSGVCRPKFAAAPRSERVRPVNALSASHCRQRAIMIIFGNYLWYLLKRHFAVNKQKEMLIHRYRLLTRESSYWLKSNRSPQTLWHKAGSTYQRLALL